MELQIEKPSMSYIPGQYLYLNIPTVSKWQWHPFTITSIPEDGFISVHMRLVGDWTRKCALLLGRHENGLTHSVTNSIKVNIDGPFGSPGSKLFKYLK